MGLPVSVTISGDLSSRAILLDVSYSSKYAFLDNKVLSPLSPFIQ